MTASAPEQTAPEATATIDPTDLKAFALVAKAINTRTSIPILSHVVVEGRSGLRFRATDLDLSLEYHNVGAGVEEGFSTTIAAKTFIAMTKGARYVSLKSISPTTVLANTATGSITLNALPADEFPAPPKAADFRAARLQNGTEAVENLARVSHSASTEEARGAVLMGTKIEIREGTVYAIATDGFQMAVAPVATGETWVEQVAASGYIVPSYALRLLEKVSKHPRAKGSGLVISITQGAGAIVHFQLGAFKLSVRAVDGQYPNYQNVLSAKYDKGVLANRKTLLENFQRAASAANDRASMVELTVSDRNQLTFKAQNHATGEYTATMTAEVLANGADEFTVAVNGTFVSKLLARMEGDTVGIAFNDPLSPIRFSETSHVFDARDVKPLVGFQIVQMPLRR
jgi:DNA polymerase-3 subunit beta